MNIDPLYCSWDTESTFLIFSDNVFGNLIYYTHLLPIVCLFLFMLILLVQNPKDKIVQSLGVISLAFTLWSLTDLVLWATANPDHTMFFWSLIIHFELFVYFGTLYFFYYYLTHKAPPLKVQIFILLSYLPIVLFGHTSLNLAAFDYTNCWREAVEGPLVLYAYVVEAIIAIWLLVVGIKSAFDERVKQGVTEISLITLGSVFFLVAFSSGNIAGTLQIDWELGQYGLLSVPFFIGFLVYLIIKYRSLSIKILATEVLVIAIIVFTASILFVRTIENVRLITILTIILSTGLGYVLVRSVKREIKQKEQIEKLAHSLEKANERLKQMDKLKSEFVSIASHQLRSPITAISGYASLISEGSYGEVPNKMKDPIERIVQSARMMATSIEDYLNVSRIEAGNMKYNYEDFNAVAEVEHICDDLRPEALKRGLVLLFRKRIEADGIINADIGKVQQIIHNLINNSIKYTPKGAITVYVHDDLKKQRLCIDIMDTGIGMGPDTQASIFQKFERGDKANKVNVKGTGLGLFVALKMAEAMKGTISAHSDGEGQGSRFTIELPLAK